MQSTDQAVTILDLDGFLPFRLAFTSNLVSDVIATTYTSPFNLRVPEWRLITVIAENEGLTQQAICSRTRMDKVTVSRIAIALERSASNADRRSRVLRLSAKGRAIFASVTPRALRLEARILSELDPGEAGRLTATLAKIDAVARSALIEEGTA
jgi:DNA-binding MarR family transcriptional regulator